MNWRHKMDEKTKKIGIFVNEYEHDVKNDKITYDEVVSLYLGSGEKKLSTVYCKIL
jgi:hypothetical protein